MRIFSLMLILPLFGQNDLRPNLKPIPRMEVHRASGKLTIDGKLNDPAWKDAAVVEFQFPWDFQTGAKQKTVARLLWDDENLYVGYDAEDSDVVAHYDKRDDPTYKDDAVELFIFPGKNRNLYYGLEMNARGDSLRLLLFVSATVDQAVRHAWGAVVDEHSRHFEYDV